MERIILIGGGTHVRYCIDIIEKEGRYIIAGIIDSKAPVGSIISGYEVLGRQEDIKEIINKHNVAAGIITIGDNYSRYQVYNQITSIESNFGFVNAIHPSVIIGSNVVLGKGIVMMAGCIINPGSKIGDFTFFATGAQVEHDNIIGDYASVSAGSITGGKVAIGKFSAITLGVVIADRLTIGENCVVGSGSLVLKDLPDNVLAYGSPCRVVRKRTLDEKFLKS